MNSRKINHFPDHLEVNLASKPPSPLEFPGPLTHPTPPEFPIPSMVGVWIFFETTH